MYNMARLQLPVIMAFANQKGGVGKTTLCACFANYLANMGVNVRIIDCDRQQSIMKCRKRDLSRYKDCIPPYPIDGFRLIDRDKMRNLISEVYSNSEDEVVLFDCPGSMTDSWLIPLFVNTDLVVIPYHYDDVTIASTSEFILYLEKIHNSISRDIPPHIFLIPNISDKRVGTYSEIKKWNLTREKFDMHGTVTPQITRKADMERISTVCNIDRQIPIVKSAFDKIYYEIFGNLKPIRDAKPFLRIKDNSKAKNNSEDNDPEIELESNYNGDRHSESNSVSDKTKEGKEI